MFVAVLICITPQVTGCRKSVGEHNLDKSSTNSASSAKSGLGSLLLEGDELHASLRTRQPESIRDLPTNAVLPGIPHLSTDDAFVMAIARGASQGMLDRKGVRSALYARYATAGNEVVIYGLEAISSADADQRENALREIWAFNASLDRAHVHRKDLVLVVIWHDGVSPECWASVKANVGERLNAPDTL